MNIQAAKAARIPTAAITGLIIDAMNKAGVSDGDASKIAELMLEADLIGADAHGVFRLPQYWQRLPAKNRLWFWISPLRSCPMARSRTTACRTSHCKAIG